MRALRMLSLPFRAVRIALRIAGPIAGTLLGPGAVAAMLVTVACSDPPAAPTRQSLEPELRPILALVGEGRHDEIALRLDTYLATEHANRAQAAFVLGYSFQKRKLYEPAREQFQQATLRQPDYWAPYHFLGFAHYYLGDIAAAREAFELHRAAHPEEGDDHFGLGLCDLEEGRLDAAEQHFAEAVALHAAASSRGSDRRREQAKAHARLGDVHELRGDLAAARDAYERAVMLWPAHHEVWHKLQRVHLRLGNEDLAVIAGQRHEQYRALADEQRSGGP